MKYSKFKISMTYKTYKEYLREVFPGIPRVRKRVLNPGFSCPGRCTYCNNASFSPVWQEKTTVAAQLEGAGPGTLAYYQPNTNTYAPFPELRAAYAPALAHPNVVGLAIGTRPDCLGEDVVELLAEANAKKPVIVEIGLQTASDPTLERIRRGHTATQFADAASRCRAAGLRVTTHVILGLPWEGREDFLRTARVVRECGCGAVKIHPLHIVKHTVMAQEYAEGKIQLLSFEEYCEAAALFINELRGEVAVERVSGEAPGDLLIAPDWCGERERIKKRLARG
jgi:radical SAM protein (TIGR01212 family)